MGQKGGRSEVPLRWHVVLAEAKVPACGAEKEIDGVGWESGELLGEHGENGEGIDCDACRGNVPVEGDALLVAEIWRDPVWRCWRG